MIWLFIFSWVLVGITCTYLTDKLVVNNKNIKETGTDNSGLLLGCVLGYFCLLFFAWYLLLYVVYHLPLPNSFKQWCKKPIHKSNNNE